MLYFSSIKLPNPLKNIKKISVRGRGARTKKNIVVQKYINISVILHKAKSYIFM
jgi:hypothetical protein